MKHLESYDGWTTTSTSPSKEVDVQYTSKDKIYYGIHTISLSREGISTDVKAKFDTGARTSSIDFSVAKRLGISNEVIEKCKELEHIQVPKNITKLEQRKIEKEKTKELKSMFKEITSTQFVKSSSGFSIRAYIKVNIEYMGKVITTEVNLRDRTGLSCEMLVGLKDML
jgi:hypothetical protein